MSIRPERNLRALFLGRGTILQHALRRKFVALFAVLITATGPLSAQDLAPDSVVDMLYIVLVLEPRPIGGIPPPIEELPHAGILARDGTRTRIDVSLQVGPRPPGRYSWSKTGARTATLGLTGSEIVSRLEMTFTAAGRGTYREIREGRSVISSGEFLLAPVPREPSPPLTNVSARMTLAAGQAATVGFVVEGPARRRVLVRAIGPTLRVFGVNNAAAAPALKVIGRSGPVAENAGWGGTQELAAVFAVAGAFALPAGSLDAVAVLTLEPGDYSVQVSSAGGGELLGEVYVLP
jgi:hypothetical protein